MRVESVKFFSSWLESICLEIETTTCKIVASIIAGFYFDRSMIVLTQLKLSDVLICVAEKFLNMPVEEKRDHYKSRNFSTLDEVKTWQQLADEELLKMEKGKFNCSTLFLLIICKKHLIVFPLQLKLLPSATTLIQNNLYFKTSICNFVLFFCRIST